MATPNEIRIVGLELLDNITALKTAVDALNTTVSAWNLKGADNVLPAGADVKTALASFDAITKPTNSLNDALASVRAVA